MIDQNDAEESLNYLAETDADYAAAKALMKGREHRLKVVRGQVFMRCTGTMAEREAKALSSDEYQQMLDALDEATTEFELLGAKRKTAECRIEFWRSVNANRRQAG